MEINSFLKILIFDKLVRQIERLCAYSFGHYSAFLMEHQAIAINLAQEIQGIVLISQNMRG